MKIKKLCLYPTLNKEKITFNLLPALVFTWNIKEKTFIIAFKWAFIHAGVLFSEQIKPDVQHTPKHSCTVIPFTQRK